MNVLFLESLEELECQDKQILEHLTNVIKPTPGDSLKIIIKDRGLFLAKLDSLTSSKATFSLQHELKKVEPWIDLIIGVSRPQTTRKILEHGTTYGVRSFHFFTAELSEKSYLSSKIFSSNEALDLLKLGLAQSARYFRVPEVKTSLFNPAAQYANFDYKFILDFEDAKRFNELNLPDLSLNPGVNIALAIGPERGFRPKDIERFLAVGFQKVTISEAVLRVEHALYSSLSQLELLTKKY